MFSPRWIHKYLMTWNLPVGEKENKFDFVISLCFTDDSFSKSFVLAMEFMYDPAERKAHCGNLRHQTRVLSP